MTIPAAITPDLLTVGILHFDDYDSLPACRASLAAQSLRPARVILVDNTPAEARRTIADDPNINLSVKVNEVNNGYAGAANQVIRDSQTPFLLLMNPDVSPEPACLE